MPECLLMAYADQQPRIEAERARLASLCAAYPHMTKDGARSWMDSLRKTARRVTSAADSLFRWNGAPVTLRDLKRQLSRTFGSGFSEE